MEQLEHIGVENVFEEFWSGVKYVVNFENPLITILVFVVLALNIILFYKKKTSKEYSNQASKMRESKILGVIPVEHPSVKDTLIVFAIAIGLFGFLMFIFLDV